MKKIFTCAATLAMMALAWNADGATIAKKSSKGKTGTKSTASKSPARKSGSTAAAGKKSTGAGASFTSAKKGSTITASAHGKKAPVKKTTWRNRQTAPSSDRYREIQSALVARGYLKEEDATGAWNQASVDALSNFQSEQNLDSKGKINSLSLIALGLGPRRDAVAAVPKAPSLPGPGQ
ncbi:MAG: putative peptidoglycan binding domain-containing protein [Candidatus Solibacter sp.]